MHHHKLRILGASHVYLDAVRSSRSQRGLEGPLGIRRCGGREAAMGTHPGRAGLRQGWEEGLPRYLSSLQRAAIAVAVVEEAVLASQQQMAALVEEVIEIVKVVS